ncbi:MAG: hypothetical protein ACRCS9_12310 [Hyphomicrobium sp.]
MPRSHLGPFRRYPVGVSSAGGTPGGDGSGGGPGDGPADPAAYRRHFLKLAHAMRRPCICYGCICLTDAEKQHQRRVLRLARAVSRQHGLGRG